MFPVTFHGHAIPISREVPIHSDGGDGIWHVPEEMPVAFVYNRRNYSVMMATSNDLVDFAIGFSLTEEIIKSPSDIKAIDIYLSHKGADMRFKVSEDVAEKLEITQRRRNMVGSASCGLCGLENADTLFKVLPRVAETHLKLDTSAMVSAISDLQHHQPINNQTHSVHAAAWVSLSGEITAIREDVGRHNALDKLLGAMAMDSTDTSNGFLLVSSRCSYEIAEKAARRGVQAIVSISGPTALALRKADEANMALYVRSEGSVVKLGQGLT